MLSFVTNLFPSEQIILSQQLLYLRDKNTLQVLRFVILSDSNYTINIAFSLKNDLKALYFFGLVLPRDNSTSFIRPHGKRDYFIRDRDTMALSPLQVVKMKSAFTDSRILPPWLLSRAPSSLRGSLKTQLLSITESLPGNTSNTASSRAG